MNRILDVFRRLHPGYANLNVYIATSTAIALGVFLVLSLLQPFNLGDRNILGNPFLAASLYAGASYFTMLLNSLWLKLFPQFFSDERWTIGKEILMYVYQVITIASTIWLINFIRGTFPPDIHGYLGMLWVVVSVGFFPCLTAQLVRHIYFIKKRLRKATAMNISLMLDKKETTPMSRRVCHKQK